MFHRRNKPVAKDINRKKIVLRLKGTKNILTDELAYWDFVIKNAIDVAISYSFKRVETPILEKLELNKKLLGFLSGKNEWSAYDFTDKDGEKIMLRADSVLSLARVFVEHNMGDAQKAVKLFWVGNVLRQIKPQSGINRQFGQIAFEIIGDNSPIADVQLIFVTQVLLSELQLDTYVQINSIGCTDCRGNYVLALKDFFKVSQRKKILCDQCKKHSTANPLDIFECQNAHCKEIWSEAPQIMDYLDDGCRAHFVKVLEYLDELGVSYNLNPYLLHGVAYGSRTIFDVWPKAEDGARSGDKELVNRTFSLAGGGRHDNLVERLGGEPVGACGVKIGIDRLILKIKEKNGGVMKNDSKKDIFLAQVGDQAKRKAMLLFEKLRKGGFRVAENFVCDSLKNQLEEVSRLGVKLTLIIGQKEVSEGTVLLRNMESGIQEVVDYTKILQELKKRV